MSVVLNADIAPAVNAIVTIDNPPVSVTFPSAQEIIISDTNDSIKIGDGSGIYADVTAASALKVDGSAVTQPISGTVTANTGLAQPLTDTQLRASPVPVSGTLSTTQGTSPWVVSAASLPLPSGAATETKQDSGNTSLSSIDSKITAVNTGAVVVSSSALPSGAATSAGQTQPGVDIGDVTINNAAGAAAVNVQDGGNSLTVDNTNLDVALSTLLKAADTLTAVTTVGTITNVVHVDDNTGSLTVDNAGTFAVQATLTAETTKVIGTVNVAAAQTIATTNAGTFAVQNTPATVSTSSVTSVAGNASNVQLLASTAGRKQATFFNDSTSILYLKLGVNASTTSYTVQLPSNAYYELPQPVYTGEIDGIWVVATGNARITELT